MTRPTLLRGGRSALPEKIAIGFLERFSADSGYFDPVIPAQAGIQEFEVRTGSRLAPGRRAYAHTTVHAMKYIDTRPENALNCLYPHSP
jgi:hypothetical protein